jgi:release factor glutamine methyltransferase
MILKDVLEKSISFLKTKEIEPAKLDSELLISDCLNIKRLDIYLQYDRPLNNLEIQSCRDRIVRRSKGEPVSLIMGKRDFCGQTFQVSRDVLTPRFETEELVEKAVDLFLHKIRPEDETLVLDLGAGSGCIGISFLLQLKKKINESPADAQVSIATSRLPRILAIEKSEKALEVLKKNEVSLLPPDLRELFQSRLGDCADPRTYLGNLTLGPINQVVAVLGNPPYIADESKDVAKDVLEYEPKQALFGGPVGTEIAEQWVRAHMPVMQPNGFFLFEIGFDQGLAMTQIFQSVGLTEVTIFKDLSGLDRMIYGRK